MIFSDLYFFLELQMCFSKDEIANSLQEFKIDFIKILYSVFDDKEKPQHVENIFTKILEIYKTFEKDAAFCL